MKIAILNSGGNSSASNVVLSRLVNHFSKTATVFAVYEGFEGLIDNSFKILTTDEVNGIENLGSIFLKTSRSAKFLTEQGLNSALKNLQLREIDFVVVTGGNGSIMGAKRLADNGIKVLTVPSTIDNDLGYTDFCLGFHTAVFNAVDVTKKIHDALSNDERGAVIETMGRECGDITKLVAKKTNADYFVVEKIDENKIINKADELVKKGNESPLLIVKEHLFDVEKLAEDLTTFTKKTFKSAIIGYIQRGGEPTKFDKDLAVKFALKIVDLISENKFNRSVGIKNKQIIDLSLNEAISIPKQ